MPLNRSFLHGYSADYLKPRVTPKATQHLHPHPQNLRPTLRKPHKFLTSSIYEHLRCKIQLQISPTMRVDRQVGSPAVRMEEKMPAPISRLIQLRHTIAQPVIAAFIAGGVAGAVSRTVVSPLERLKILFQIQSAGRTGYQLPIGQGLMKMWRDEGWRGFMRGNGANCIRIIPYSAVQFASYNAYRKVSKQELPRS